MTFTKKEEKAILKSLQKLLRKNEIYDIDVCMILRDGINKRNAYGVYK